jgi:hypothetical protein
MGRPRKRQRSEQEPEDVRKPQKAPALNRPAAPYYPMNETILINSHNNPTVIEPWLIRGAAELGIQQYMVDPHPIPHTASTVDYTSTSAYSQSPAYHTPASGTGCGSPTVFSQRTCNCMSILTNIMEQMRTFETFQFPISVGLLRNALSTVKMVIDCQVCADGGMSALQNTTLLQATLFSLVDRFNVMLKSMNTEADRLAQTGETKCLKVADPTDLTIMHTGTPDCPAGLVVQISGEQWREMSRRALRKLLYGEGDGLSALLDIWESRQTKWHSDLEMLLRRQEILTDADCQGEDGTQPGGCISVISRIRSVLGSIKI